MESRLDSDMLPAGPWYAIPCSFLQTQDLIQVDRDWSLEWHQITFLSNLDISADEE
jgi:hypothetical protein